MVLAVLAGAALWLAVPGVAAAANGDVLFKQCIVDPISSLACTKSSGIVSPYDVAVSPDGKQAYVSAWQSSAGSGGGLYIFDRNPVTGALTRRAGATNCYRDTPSSGDCTDVESMNSPLDVQVSRDGKHVYVAAWGSSGVTIFDRNTTTGRLTQKAAPNGCLKDGGDGITCKAGRALGTVIQLTPSADFRNLYATAQTAGGSLDILKVDPTTGNLSQDQSIDGCVTSGGDDGNGHPNSCTPGTAMGIGFQATVSPDGKNVYGASQGPSAVTVFNRDATTGALTQKNGVFGCLSADGTGGSCTPESHLSAPETVRSSKDGRFVYAFSSNGTNGSIVTFARSATNGTLSFVRCLNEAGNNGCGNANAISSVETAAISPDGNALAVLNTTGRISFFSINQSTGVLTQRPGTQGCVSADGNAPDGAGGTLAGACRVVATIAGEGNVEFPTNTTLNYAAISSAVNVFDRDFAPVCSNGSVSVPFNTAVAVGLHCSDVNGDAITLQITQAPGAGLLGAIDQGNRLVRYSPFASYKGPDAFRFRGVARGVASNTATVNVSVSGPTGGGVNGNCLDADGDGFCAGQDCNDHNAKINPAAREIRGNNIDEDCNGRASQFPDLASTVLPTWSVVGNKTKALAFQLKGLKRGWKVVMTCKGKGCPFKKKTIKNKKVKKGSFNAVKKMGSKRTFKAGSTLTVKFTAPKFNTKFSIFKFKSSPHLPKGSARCQTRGKSKLRACH